VNEGTGEAESPDTSIRKNGTTGHGADVSAQRDALHEAVLNAELSDWLNKHASIRSREHADVTLQSIQMVFKMYELLRRGMDARPTSLRGAGGVRAFENRFDDLGKSLSKAQAAFEVAKGHLNRYRNRVTGLTGRAGARA